MKQESTIDRVQRTTGVGAHKDVQIISDDGQVDPDVVDIYSGQEAIWFAHNSQAGATIDFSSADGSPFYAKTFYVPAGGTVSSGLARNDAQSKRYKYTVKGPTGQNDPVVIIHN
jgi:hypothetical protein